MQRYGKPPPPSFLLSFVVKIIAIAIVAALVYYFCFSGSSSIFTKKAESDTTEVSDAIKDSTPSEAGVDLSESQLNAIKIETLGPHSFRVEKEAVGSVSYHEKDMNAGSAAKFVVANIPESDSPLIHVGQAVTARMIAYPGRDFDGKVTTLGVSIYDSGGNPAIDPGTHRIAVRCEIADPKNELYPGMLATIAIEVGKPVKSPAVPVNGVVRKGDGTMTVWLTRDRRHFTERTVRIGLRQNGYAQIIEGVQPEELIVTDGAVFLNNILYAPPAD